MPYVITRCWYPNHLVDEVANKYIEIMEKYNYNPLLALFQFINQYRKVKKNLWPVMISFIQKNQCQ